MTNKVILLVIVFALIFGVLGWFILHPIQPKTQSNQKITLIGVTKRSDLATAVIPTTFPSNFPIEAKAKVTQNFNLTTTDGVLQSERIFITSKTLDSNLKIYQDYFNKNSWTLGPVLNQPTVKIISASKNGFSAQVTLSIDPKTKENLVDIKIIEQ